MGRALATSGSRSVLSPSEPLLAARSATPLGSPGLSTTWTGSAPRLTESAARRSHILPSPPVCCCKILFVVFQIILTKKIQIKRWTQKKKKNLCKKKKKKKKKKS